MDLRELIRDIRLPTLVIVGDKDPATRQNGGGDPKPYSGRQA